MANLAGFDANQIPEQQEFSAIPEGQYLAMATASEEKVTAKGTGEYLQFVFEVLDGQYRGRKLWSRMNLKNPNKTAVEIAQRELAALCRSVGVPKPQDSAELHNKPLLLTVGIEIDDRRRENNIIRKYEPANGAAQPAAAPAFSFAPAAPAAAPWGAPSQTAPQPSTAPWQK